MFWHKLLLTVANAWTWPGHDQYANDTPTLASTQTAPPTVQAHSAVTGGC
jgi:hypothetical protein